jgi:hypothetical protein
MAAERLYEEMLCEEVAYEKIVGHFRMCCDLCGHYIRWVRWRARVHARFKGGGAESRGVARCGA